MSNTPTRVMRMSSLREIWLVVFGHVGVCVGGVRNSR